MQSQSLIGCNVCHVLPLSSLNRKYINIYPKIWIKTYMRVENAKENLCYSFSWLLSGVSSLVWGQGWRWWAGLARGLALAPHYQISLLAFMLNERNILLLTSSWVNQYSAKWQHHLAKWLLQVENSISPNEAHHTLSTKRKAQKQNKKITLSLAWIQQWMGSGKISLEEGDNIRIGNERLTRLR